MDVEKQLVSGASDSHATTPLRPSFDHDLTRERLGELIYSGKDELYGSAEEQRNRLQFETSSSRTSFSEENTKDDIEKGPDGANPHDAPGVSPSKDPNLVDWDGPSDPDNPQNWSLAKKWYITMILSCLTFCITFSSSIFSQATGVTAELYDVSTEVTTLATSLFVLVCSLNPADVVSTD
jgi:hypothetical protein